MHFKHGRYYYVHANRWHALSREFPEALKQYADLIKQGDKTTLARDMADVMAKAVLAPNTRRAYEHSANVILDAFREFHPSQVKPHHIGQFMDAFAGKPSMANRHRNVLMLLFAQCVRVGSASVNPVRDIKPFKSRTRDRYITAQEYAAIRSHAAPEIALMMDMAYITGQRVSNVRLLRLSDVSDAGVYVKQQKTNTKLLIEMTPDLRETIAAVKALHPRVQGLTLFHNRQGAPWSDSYVRQQWRKACLLAGVEGATFHDIRAAAGTDAKRAGIDSKALLGHRSDSAHQRYMRDKDVQRVTPNRKRS
jgi:integrase